MAALTISGGAGGFNPLGRAWNAYERSLRRHPVLTQAASSALLWGMGDAMAQRIEARCRGDAAPDGRRTALTAAFGGAVIGPAGHAWYQALEALVLRCGLAGSSRRAMLLKVVLDNLVYSPAYVLAFFAFGCLAIDRLSPAEFREQLRSQFVPTMLAEALVWPPYMALVFSRVPVPHQLLAVNVATLFDVCFLSWVRCAHDHAAAAAAAADGGVTEHLHSGSCDAGTASEDGAHVVAAAAAAGAAVTELEPAQAVTAAVAAAAALPESAVVSTGAGGGGGAGNLLLRLLGQRGQRSPQKQQQPQSAGEALRRELEECLWDVTTPEPTLGHKALLLASSSTSSYSGSRGGSSAGAWPAF
ncbi:hypothetical protein HYH02_002467 [Chlamydomonas schloesseri]|uniref:Uncharacterized protein n=1 Tax=Chlamydomonas schloesseri TaxID=2026947 RepID=A0A836BB05_9CHLO|nr:hypothetical protein HYH02_002467 [Chlamydomonas schloesseri]|eukprot:KAG2453141.1 hypothetical protein HYH02_002467 [Chlamydomonas schloesseri]